MQLFELVSPRLFRPLAGPNRAFYAELLLLLWEECRHTADYSISRAEAVSRAEDYFAALAKPLALDADGAGDEDEQPTRDPHTLAVGFLLRLRRTGWLEEQPGSYESEPTLACFFRIFSAHGLHGMIILDGLYFGDDVLIDRSGYLCAVLPVYLIAVVLRRVVTGGNYNTCSAS